MDMLSIRNTKREWMNGTHVRRVLKENSSPDSTPAHGGKMFPVALVSQWPDKGIFILSDVSPELSWGIATLLR